MAPTSEASLSSKDDHFHYDDMTSIGSVEMETPQYLGDFDNSCETFFCRRNSPLLSRSVIPEASPTFRRVLGDMDNSFTDDDEDILENTSTNTSPSSPPSSSPLSSSVAKSKSIPTFSRKTSSSQSNFLSVPSSLSSLRLPSHADISDSGAHTTLAGLSLRKNAPRMTSSFQEGDGLLSHTGLNGASREKRVSWADERGTKHQLITVRLIRPRLSTDSIIEIAATPSHSILRRQVQV